ncbi:MAG: polysaccharide pyruvyl transferase family protein [Phycisphaerales bacterium]|nr:polysaccharide pyruvyl transferase family protein [Phycisphaerales bacterium]
MNILLENGGHNRLNVGDVVMTDVAATLLAANDRVKKLRVITSAPDAYQSSGIAGEPLGVKGKRLYLCEWNTLGPLRPLRKIVPLSTREKISIAEEKFRRNHPSLATALIKSRFIARPNHAKQFNTFLDTVNDSDILCISGGGNLNDSFLDHAFAVLELAEIFLAQSKPVAFFSQGLGPATNPRLCEKLKSVLPRCTLIGLRDNIVSTKLLNQLEIQGDHIKITGDDAIVAVNDFMDSNPQITSHSIGVNIRTARYAGMDQQQASHISKMIAQAAADLNMPIQPVPISWQQGGNDLDSISDAMDVDDHIFKEVANPLDPISVIKLTARCKVVFTGSYHAAVFALAQGIPVIALSTSEYYDTKFLGLLNQFGNIGLTLVRPAEVHTPQEARLVLTQAIENAPQNKAALIEHAKTQSNASKALYQSLWDAIDQTIPATHSNTH